MTTAEVESAARVLEEVGMTDEAEQLREEYSQLTWFVGLMCDGEEVTYKGYERQAIKFEQCNVGFRNVREVNFPYGSALAKKRSYRVTGWRVFLPNGDTIDGVMEDDKGKPKAAVIESVDAPMFEPGTLLLQWP